MKKTGAVLLFICSLLFGQTGQAGHYHSLWKEAIQYTAYTEPLRLVQKYKVFHLRDGIMQSVLQALPDNPDIAPVVELPAPDGSLRSFRVWQTYIMEAELAGKYPQIRTYSAVAVDNPMVTAKLDHTPAGFHAMIYNGTDTWFIDPCGDEHNDYYQVYYKRDCIRSAADYMSCYTDEVYKTVIPGSEPDRSWRLHGSIKRTYRLALACTGEYAVAVAGPNPSKAAVLARMVVTLNRVNGVYERELAVTMQLVAQTDTLIFLDGSADPYNNNNGYALMAQNQAETNDRIGVSGYDIGHVFSTGGGGIAQKGSVCNNYKKAMGVTGAQNPQGDAFDIDYVAHEIGHQFGADHTFNSIQSACGNGNRVAASAYEPGSGSTVMGYAGLCGSDNLQSQGDVYFHARSLEQITAFLESGGTCGTTSATGQTPPSLPAFAASYSIPYLTPFELSATQPAAGQTWCWEEWDLSSTEFSWAHSRLSAPLFRSFAPDVSSVRVFPALPKLINNITAYTGEKLPDTARQLRFRLTVRNVYNGMGSFNFSDDYLTLYVIRTTAPFKVTMPDVATVSWKGGSTQTITWDVGGTDIAPVSCNLVDIYLSVDGGYTYPVPVASGLPNTGTAVIAVPNVNTTSAARIKVKAHGNVFFDISNENFTIEHDDNLPYPSDISSVHLPADIISIYPMPAYADLYLKALSDMSLHVHAYNAHGQLTWSGALNKELNISVSGWSRGIYYFRFSDASGNMRITKRVVIQ